MLAKLYRSSSERLCFRALLGRGVGLRRKHRHDPEIRFRRAERPSSMAGGVEWNISQPSRRQRHRYRPVRLFNERIASFRHLRSSKRFDPAQQLSQASSVLQSMQILSVHKHYMREKSI